MGSKNDKIIKLTAKKFNKKRKLLLPAGITASLVKKAGDAGTYTNLFNLDDYWYEFNTWRERTLIQVARQDTPFVSALTQASDVRIGTDYYEIDKRDVRAPDGKHPYWEIATIMDFENR